MVFLSNFFSSFAQEIRLILVLPFFTVFFNNPNIIGKKIIIEYREEKQLNSGKCLDLLSVLLEFFTVNEI